MAKIQRLDPQTANQIAAGEVVERPASVVRELCDNALDAGASQIRIQIEQGGIRRIRVEDNGSGMEAEDAYLAFEPHATSKIRRIEDLDQLQSMGFRGEALASIAAVARVTLRTQTAEAEQGIEIYLEAGQVREERKAKYPIGCQLTVEDLFYNTPARYKFLKSDRSEQQKVLELVTRLALARPEVSFSLEANGKNLLHTPGDGQLMSAAWAVYGEEVAQQLLTLSYEVPDDPIQITGLLGQPSLNRRSRLWEHTIINKRPVIVPSILRAVEDAYQGRLMKGDFPFAILQLEISPELIDVNVHPQKLELRFWNDQQVYRTVRQAVEKALEKHTYISYGAEVEKSPLLQLNDEPSCIVQPNNQDVSISNPSQYKQQQTLSNEHNVYTSKHHEVSYLTPEAKAFQQWELSTPPRSNSLGSLGDSLKKEDAYPLAQKFQVGANKTYLPADESGPSDSPVLRPESGSDESSEERRWVLTQFLQAKWVGTLFHTYLLFEKDERYFIVDQHAAHEKILYERLLAHASEHQGTGGLGQHLLFPLDLSLLNSVELGLIRQHQQALEAIGYAFTWEHEQAKALECVPYRIETEKSTPGRQQNIVETLRLLLDRLAQEPYGDKPTLDEAAYRLYFATKACKAAVKAHDHLDAKEVEILRQELVSLVDPFQCPHGRPIFIMRHLQELEQAFKRIV